MFALDTNTLIDFFKGQGRVAEHLLAQSPSQIAIPIVVVYELEVGLTKSGSATKRQAQFEQLLDTVTVLPFDRQAASASARIRGELEARGEPIGPLDTLIAGTALAHGATLVTRNVSEFDRIEHLAVENWFD